MNRLTAPEVKEQDRPVERSPTGDLVLDSMLGGGLPKNRVTYVVGNPGTGKTSLGGTFAYRGAKDYGETSVYLSFAEPKEVFYKNMKTFGFDFESLEEDQKFEYIEMLMKQDMNMTTISDKIVAALVRLQPKRLVIDSFSAVAECQAKPNMAREIIDTVFNKMTSSNGCTTLVIGEQNSGEARLGLASEEFVSDGVLHLKYTLPRELEIRKMRGTKIEQRKLFYTINEKGFQTVKTSLATPDSPRTWKPIADSDDLLSSGSPDFDRVIGGGFPRGEYVVLEADTNVTLEEIKLLTQGIFMNFISQGRGVIFSTTGGEARDGVRKSFVPYLTGESVNRYLKVVEHNTSEVRKPDAPPPVPTSVSDDLGYQSRMGDVYAGLKKDTGDQPIFHWIGYDTLASSFSVIPDEKVVHQIGSNISENRRGKDLTIALARPSLRILDTISDIINWHLKLWKMNGVLIVQGVKPETHMYAVDTQVDLGYPVMCLTELT
jgi:KaiC/GvpD/RAD55 family RecA-like ATPase